MKKTYLKPMMNVQTFETKSNIMDVSLYVIDTDNSKITDSSEILVNKHSVWDEE